MRESISVTAIFQIVILFILLFTAIMCLTINNSNAFAIKDDIINIIELANGNYLDGAELNDEIIEAINSATYRTTGVCDDDYTGYRKDGMQVNRGEKASICIKEVNVTDEIEKSMTDAGLTIATGDFGRGKYYQIIVFYQLDLPVINQVYNMKTKGETRIIYDL